MIKIKISNIRYFILFLIQYHTFLQSILDVAAAKLNVRVNTIAVDIRGMPSEEDKELEATDRNNIQLALTILQCILVFKQGEFVKVNICLTIIFHSLTDLFQNVAVNIFY